MKHYSIIGLTFVVCVLFSITAYGDKERRFLEDEGRRFKADLSGAQEVVFDNGEFVPGGTETEARGRIRANFDRSFYLG